MIEKKNEKGEIIKESIMKERIEKNVIERIKLMEEALKKKDYQIFAKVTMEDSDEMHKICEITKPESIIYLNDISKKIQTFIKFYNEYYSEKLLIKNFYAATYTFDAGPNSVFYILEKYEEEIFNLINYYFISTEKIKINEEIKKFFEKKDFKPLENSLKNIIRTSLGEGAKIINEHLSI